MDSDTQLYIDGQWRPGRGGQAPVLNPANEETIGSHAIADKADLDDALAAAARGFEKWRRTSALRAVETHAPRRRSVARAQRQHRARDDDGAGKAACRGAGRGGGRRRRHRLVRRRRPARLRPHRSRPRRRTCTQLVVKEPVGPVAAFSPWNFPINQAVRKISGALAAGCSIIIKGPEDTPASCAALVARLRRRRPAGRRDQPRLRRAVGDLGISHPAPDRSARSPSPARPRSASSSPRSRVST